MTGRKVLIFLCAAGAFALPRESFAQPAAPAQQITKQILDDVAATSEAAISLAREGNYQQAARLYETLLERWPNAMDASTTYPALMVLAAAHLEAAVNRVTFADKARGSKANHTLAEQPLNVVNDHLAQVYTLVGTAANRAGGTRISGPDKEGFVCQARLRLAAAITLHGFVNSNASELDKGAAGYEQTEACNPDARNVAKRLRGESLNVANSPRGSDAIADTVSRFAKATGTVGGVIGTVLNVSYDFYKKSQPLVLPR